MKSNFILSVVFNFVGCIFAKLPSFVEFGQRQLIGVVVLAIVSFSVGSVYLTLLVLKFLDRIDEIHGIQAELKKMASIDNTYNKTIEILNKIDRHICTGFNVVSENLTEK